ncbi:MAG: hypothetical protein ABI723_16750 [Bacteroidia bacterium]
MKSNKKLQGSSDLKRWMERWTDLKRFNKKVFYQGHLSYMLTANQLIPKQTKDEFKGRLNLEGGRRQMLLELRYNSGKTFLLN